ncbi:MAG: phosphotransferase [candidate division Zixibacteria bacterium]|nr:phosphotransferase [candidate division Zixibacteria bacterium]
MTSLSPAPPEELVHQACHEAGLGRLRQCRLYKSGPSHSVYRVLTPSGTVAVRVGRGNSVESAWQQNSQLVSLCLAPRLLHDRATEFGRRKLRCTIWEWRRGRPLDPRRDVRRMADALGRLHRRTRGSRIAPVTEPDLRKFLRGSIFQSLRRADFRGATGGRLQRVAENVLGDRNQHGDWPASFQCLVHNDLVVGNILVESGRVWLIDWDWAMNASPALDLCGFLSPFVRSWDEELYLSRRGAAIFVRRYLSLFGRADARAILGELVRAWDTYNAAVALWVYQFAGREQPHLRSHEFYQRAFARSVEISRWLKTQITT